MQLKTVLNRVHKMNGFVYGKAEFAGERIEVEVHPRKGSGPICSGCGERGPGYDVLDGPGSSCRCGRSAWCCCMRCVGWTASDAG